MELDFIDAEARTRYTDRRQLDLQRCQESLQKKDFSVLEMIGHNLKGNGISFGFPVLSHLVEKMEKAASSSDLSLCTACIAQLHPWLDSLNKNEGHASSLDL